MKRMSWTVVLPALLVASGLFLSAHTALADEGEARSRMYEIGTAIEPLTLPAVTGGTPPFTIASRRPYRRAWCLTRPRGRFWVRLPWHSLPRNTSIL